MRSLILSAGRGKRLRPITDSIPKALCKVAGIPLIEHHILNLARAGITDIYINHAYLGGKIKAYLGSGSRFDVNLTYLPEPPGALETGGGIFNAHKIIGPEPLLVINSDIFTNFPLATLTTLAFDYAHIILVPKPDYYTKSDFGLENGLLTNQGPYTFAGIACYHPNFLQTCNLGRYSIAPLLRAGATAKLVTAEIFTGTWMDIGSPERLQAAQRNELA